MRADTRDRRTFLHRFAVFRVPSDSDVRRSRPRRTLIAMFAVLMLVPLLGVLLVRKEIDVCGRGQRGRTPP